MPTEIDIEELTDALASIQAIDYYDVDNDMLMDFAWKLLNQLDNMAIAIRELQDAVKELQESK